MYPTPCLQITKLREQFEANQYHAPARSGIFRGVAIHVNGYTNPTHAVGATCKHAEAGTYCSRQGIVTMQPGLEVHTYAHTLALQV